MPRPCLAALSSAPSTALFLAAASPVCARRMAAQERATAVPLERSSSWPPACSLTSVITMTCRSHAEAFAKKLQHRLRNLGGKGLDDDDSGEEEQFDLFTAGYNTLRPAEVVTSGPLGLNDPIFREPPHNNNNSIPPQTLDIDDTDSDIFYDFDIESPESDANVAMTSQSETVRRQEVESGCSSVTSPLDGEMVPLDGETVPLDGKVVPLDEEVSPPVGEEAEGGSQSSSSEASSYYDSLSFAKVDLKNPDCRCVVNETIGDESVVSADNGRMCRRYAEDALPGEFPNNGFNDFGWSACDSQHCDYPPGSVFANNDARALLDVEMSNCLNYVNSKCENECAAGPDVGDAISEDVDDVCAERDVAATNGIDGCDPGQADPLPNVTERMSRLVIVHSGDSSDSFLSCCDVGDDDHKSPEESPEESDLKPRIKRSSSLKSGKTPPGTPGRKKIVRFADVLGLDLANVRTYLDDVPNVPQSAFQDLSDMEERRNLFDAAPMLGTAGAGLHNPKSLVPMFDQPGGRGDFLDRVREHKVSLENFVVLEDMTLQGVVRVLNMDFHKSVYVRYTLDEWKTHHDLQARYLQGTCDGFSDKFSFVLYGHTLEAGARLMFAIRYHCAGQQFWDNNFGHNYVCQCFLHPPHVQDDYTPWFY